MRKYIFNYVEVFQSLQNRKTLLLKSSSIFEQIRRKFVFVTRVLNSIFAEKQAFDNIQFALFTLRRLIHANVKKQLYEDIDVNKKFDIELMIYHVKNEKDILYFFRSNILFIVFFSRQLKSIEKNY